MTKGTETYGLGIGMQLGGYGEWYQRAPRRGRPLSHRRSQGAGDQHAGGDPGHRSSSVDFSARGIAPPQGTYDYNTAPDAFIGGKLATYSSDLTIAAVLGQGDEPPTFEWAVLAHPPGRSARQFQRHRLPTA